MRRIATLVAAIVVSLVVTVQAAFGVGYSWDYKIMYPGEHWSCLHGIAVYVSTHNSPDGHRVYAVYDGMEKVKSVSRLRYTWSGWTTRTPSNVGYQEVVVYFASPSEMAKFGKLSNALAFSWHDTNPRITKGWIVVNNAYARAYTPSWTRDVIMHELGHVSNLGHAQYNNERMYGGAWNTTVLKSGMWGAGDYTGLRKVGC